MILASVVTLKVAAGGALAPSKPEESSYDDNTTLASPVRFTGAEGLAGCRPACNTDKLWSWARAVSSSLKRGDTANSSASEDCYYCQMGCG